MSMLLVAVVILLQLADGWTTYRAITNGFGQEKTKIVRWVMDRVGVYWALLMLKGGACVFIAAGQWLDWWVSHAAQLGLFALAVYYVSVVRKNWFVLRNA